MSKRDGNIAFKCTWNDAGFKGICSQSAYDYNVSKNRVWCKKAECRTFTGIPTDKDHPCYESILFSEWRFGAGWDHRNVQRPRVIKHVKIGKIALLTTLEPGQGELNRRITGFFKIDRIKQGHEEETVVYGDTAESMEIDPTVSIKFWDYYRNPRKPDRRVWGTGLFRYLDDGVIVRFLQDLKRMYIEGDFPQDILSRIDKNIRGYGTAIMPNPRPITSQDQKKVCPYCGHLNLQQAKFCNSCGQKLGLQCSACQAQNPPGSKYCLECGAKLDGNPPSDPSAIAERLIEFGRSELKKPRDWMFVRQKDADRLVREDANAFLFAVILDQGVDAEKAWGAPYELRKRMGHLNPADIAGMPLKELEKYFSEGNKLHRFWPTMARRIKNACELIVAKYGGDAKNIWSDKPDSRALYKRLIEFDGIGQKKGSMAVNILYRDLGIEIKDPSGIDVSYDEMVRRVFLRTGLVKVDTMKDVVQAARELNPEYPAELDYPSWIVGRKWCLPKNPKCVECPLNDICPKFGIE